MANTRFRLRGYILFNRNVDGLKDVLDGLLDKAGREALMRGVPRGEEAEAASIKGWEANENRLQLLIESGRRVRAHEALLRISKVLAEGLGAKHKVGVRGLGIEDYVAYIPITGIIGDAGLMALRAIPQVDVVEAREGLLQVRFKKYTEADVRRRVPDRVLRLLAEALERPVKAEEAPTPLILMQGKPKPIKFDKDPAEVSLELGWIKEFPGRGQWIYTAPYARLLNVIEDILVREVAVKLGFQEVMFPKLIPLEVMQRMPGYLDDIPEGMYYVCPPPREPEAFAAFKHALKVERRVPVKELRSILKDPAYVLSPAQCEAFYQLFAHETLSVEDLPITFFDSSGWTYRWEGGGVEGIVRLQEFRRIELVYLGTPEQVVELRGKILREGVRVADELLDLEWRVVAAAPFYMRKGPLPEDVRDGRNVPAYDIEVYMPYRGPRDRAEWLEVAGCFIHKTKFIDSFKIREVKGREIWTGCSGFGVSRWVAAFLASHGFEAEKWPEGVRGVYGPPIKLPGTLQWPLRRLGDV